MTDRDLLLTLAHHVRSATVCSQCKRPFTCPRLLPACLHTFCHECLNQLLIENVPNIPCYRLQCPKCFCESVIPRGGIEALTKNYFAEKLHAVANPILDTVQGCNNHEFISDFIRRLNDVTECPVCRERCFEPRMLPCVHTFCIACLEGCATDPWSFRTLKCPLCRHAFSVPVRGLRALPVNDMLQKVLNKLAEPDVQKMITRLLNPDTVPNGLREVVGVAELSGRLYILMGQSKHVRVYLAQAPFAMIDQVELTDCVEPSDLATSPIDNCIYVTDTADVGCVWRIQVEEKAVESEMVKVFCAELECTSDRQAESSNVLNGIDLTSQPMGEEEQGKEFVSDEDASDTKLSQETELTMEEMPLDHLPDAVVQEILAPNVLECTEEDQAQEDNVGVLQLQNVSNEDLSQLSQDVVSAETVTGSVKIQQLIVNMLNGSRGGFSVNGGLWPARTDINVRELSLDREKKAMAATGVGNGVADLIHGLLERTGLLKSIAARQQDGIATGPHVWQLTTQHNVERWLVGVKALGLSVGVDGQLVLITDAGHLIIYRNDGQLVACHTLPTDICKPRHAVFNAVNGSFIVSYSNNDGTLHSVSELQLDPISVELRVIRSYRCPTGRTIRHLRWPRHLAIDSRGYVFVADCGNDRVLLLDTELEIDRIMLSRIEGLERPWRLCLDAQHGNLIVGSVTGSIKIFHIAT